MPVYYTYLSIKFPINFPKSYCNNFVLSLFVTFHTLGGGGGGDEGFELTDV